MKNKWIIENTDNKFVMNVSFRWKWQAKLWLKLCRMIGVSGFYDIKKK